MVVVKHRNFDFKRTQSSNSDPPIIHMVVITVYKEPVDLVSKTVSTLSEQTLVRNTVLVLALEEKTPDLRQVMGELCGKVAGTGFREVLFVVHPSGVPGEIPGKCSNMNHGIRTGICHLRNNYHHVGGVQDLDRVLVTNGDADSKFHPRYLEALEYKYQGEKDSAMGCVFQAPLLYNW